MQPNTFENDLNVILARFIATLVLHISLMDKVAQSLVLMKYAMNHWYRFENFNIAFWSMTF